MSRQGRLRTLSPDSGFFHGGATCDLDGDGGLDLVLANSAGQRVFTVHEVQPDGTLTSRPTHPTSRVGGGGIYSVECFGLDEDGRADLVFGVGIPRAAVTSPNRASRLRLGRPNARLTAGSA